MTIPEPERPGWPPWMERWFLPFFKEELLLPVWLVAVAQVVTATAAGLVFGLRDRNPFALLVVVVAAFYSYKLASIERAVTGRSGRIGGTVALCWVLIVATAGLGARYAIL